MRFPKHETNIHHQFRKKCNEKHSCSSSTADEDSVSVKFFLELHIFCQLSSVYLPDVVDDKRENMEVSQLFSCALPLETSKHVHATSWSEERGTKFFFLSLKSLHSLISLPDDLLRSFLCKKNVCWWHGSFWTSPYPARAFKL